jgi:hypothetical protein
MNRRHLFWFAVIVGVVTISGTSASGALTSSYEFNGRGNWSIDGNGFGFNDTTILARVPSGSFVEHAYLYASTSFDFGPPPILLDGTTYSGLAWTDLGTNGVAGLRAYRTDVTNQMRSAIGTGGGSQFGFPVTKAGAGPTLNIDGIVLAIVYSNPQESDRNIAFYDGFVPASGTVSHTFPKALHLSAASFEALVSLGIGFSTGGRPQHSTVDVDGRRLTSAAGGDDDGPNGDLITVGGIGDSPLNPPDPFHVDRPFDYYDDELYNLALGNSLSATPFVAPGQTQLSLFLNNPGDHDDLIFFTGLNTVMEIPEPAECWMALIVSCGIAMLGCRIR